MSDQPKDQSKDEPQDDSVSSENLPAQTGAPAPAEQAAKSAENPAASDDPAPAPGTGSTRRQTSWTGLIGLFVAVLASAGVAYLWNEQQAQQDMNAQFGELQRTLATQGTTRNAELSRITGDVEYP